MSTDYAEKYETARDRIYAVLVDLEWHSNSELVEVGGNRYGARLLELRRLGYDIEAEDLPDHGRRYRLRSIHPGTPQPKRGRVYLDEADLVALLNGSMSLFARDALASALGSLRANKGKL